MLVLDPLGNLIEIPDALNITYEGNSEVYDNLDRIVSGPMMVFERSNKLHYYRSVGWNITAMLNVKKVGKKWIAYECVTNPSIDVTGSLYVDANRLL